MNLHLLDFVTLYAFAGILAVAALRSATSRINQFYFFSRSIPQHLATSAQAKAIELNYRTRTWLTAVVALVCFGVVRQALHLRNVPSVFLSLLVQILLGIVVYALAHRAAGALAAGDELAGEPVAASSAVVALSEPEGFSNRRTLMLFAAPLLTLVAWLGILALTHMTPSQLDDATDAAGSAFLAGLGTGALVAACGVFVMVRFFSRNRTPMGRYSVTTAFLMAWAGAAIAIAGWAVVPLHLQINRSERIAVSAVLYALALLRALYIWLRSNHFTPAAVERRGDDRWILGQFYWNPADPTLFIQHRCGPGYTLNFGNFFAWPLAALFFGNFVFLACISGRS